MKETQQFLNEWEMHGTWHGYEVPATLARCTLDEMQNEIRARQLPESPELRQAAITARNALVRDLRLRSDVLRELLSFNGQLRALYPLLKQWIPETHLALRKLLIELVSLRTRQRMNLLKQGTLGQPWTLCFAQKNRVLDGYLNTIERLMNGSATGNDTLDVKTVVIGAGYRIPAVDDMGLDNQIGSAKVPGEQITLGRQSTWVSFFGLADNNGASTTVTSAVSSTQFDVASTAGFQIGDRLQIQTAAGQRLATLLNIAGSTLTIDTPAASVPVAEDVVIQAWGESGLKGNGDGDTQFTRSRFLEGGYVKTNTKAVLVESSITTRSIGA